MNKKGAKMKGYKCFDENLKCRGFQYEVGEEYKHDGEIKLCGSGFHFCKKAVDVFNYYDFNPKNRVCVVESGENTKTENDKSVTNYIKIINELSWNDVLDIVNIGDGNSGHRNSGHRNSGNWNSGDRNSGHRNSGNWNSGNWNSGDRNSGHRNSGHWNSGDWNSGHRNSGHWNSGNWNSGDRNSGHRNSGHWNSGDRNSGHRNSGHWNSGDWNSGDWNSCNNSSGVFCTETQNILIFDTASNLNIEKWRNSDAFYICSKMILTRFINESEMSDKEKTEHKYFYTTGGYLKVYEYKEACGVWWEKLTKNERQTIKEIPNFNADKFKTITGIKV